MKMAMEERREELAKDNSRSRLDASIALVSKYATPIDRAAYLDSPGNTTCDLVQCV